MHQSFRPSACAGKPRKKIFEILKSDSEKMWSNTDPLSPIVRTPKTSHKPTQNLKKKKCAFVWGGAQINFFAFLLLITQWEVAGSRLAGPFFGFFFFLTSSPFPSADVRIFLHLLWPPSACLLCPLFTSLPPPLCVVPKYARQKRYNRWKKKGVIKSVKRKGGEGHL